MSFSMTASKSAKEFLISPSHKWKVPLSKRAAMALPPSASTESISSVQAATIWSYSPTEKACFAFSKPL